MIGSSRTGLPLPQCLPKWEIAGTTFLRKRGRAFVPRSQACLSTLPLGLALTLGHSPRTWGVLGFWAHQCYPYISACSLWTRHYIIPHPQHSQQATPSSSQEEDQNGQAGPRQWRQSPERSTVTPWDIPATIWRESRDGAPLSRVTRPSRYIGARSLEPRVLPRPGILLRHRFHQPTG